MSQWIQMWRMQSTFIMRTDPISSLSVSRTDYTVSIWTIVGVVPISLLLFQKQKEHFSDVDNKKAALARYVQECLCLLSDTDLADAIDKGGIQECGIEQKHIKIANVIYGPAKAAIEGKTVQRKNKMPCESSMLLSIPPKYH